MLPEALRREHLARTVADDDATALAAAPAGRIAGFAMTPLAVSATQVRALLAAGRSARYLLPPAVIDYIEFHHLYRSRNGS
jgi:nicotinate-nucleotide adenylyltransferase